MVCGISMLPAFFASEHREIKNSEETVKLQEDIGRFGCWARSWGMRFQPVKCQYNADYEKMDPPIP